MNREKIEWFSKETIELAKKVMDGVSPQTWHKIMNPYCGPCMAERGREVIKTWEKNKS